MLVEDAETVRLAEKKPLILTSMPELPEVEAARRLLLRHCQGARVRSVEALADDIVLDGCAAGEVEVALRGAALLDVHRMGKHLW